jgi:transcription elongation GreA/GreB family factor
VNCLDDDDNNYQFTIVGEDEADIKLNKISWVSPLAKALLHQHLGDTVTWKRPIGDLTIEITKIDYY